MLTLKNLARRNLICFAILAAILIALCFVDFMIPTTNTRFVGFVNAITKDMDIEGEDIYRQNKNYMNN